MLGCITAWYGNCTTHNSRALQRVMRSAQHITGGKLPALQDTYSTRCHRKAKKIIKDNNCVLVYAALTLVMHIFCKLKNYVAKP
jgi:hypothetical protein